MACSSAIVDSSFSSDLPDRTEAAAVEELPNDGLIAGQQHLARPKHDQMLTEHDQMRTDKMPMLSGTVRAIGRWCGPR